jgi:aminodeoxyfutalosine synthase
METTLLDPLLERAASGGELTETERRTVYETRDVLGLGMAADARKRALHGASITFVRVAELGPGDPLDWPDRAGEVRLQGPLVDVGAATARVSAAVARSGGVPVTGFSLADVERAAEGSAARAKTILTALHDAGLASLADVPLDLLRSADEMIDAARLSGVSLLRLTVANAPAEQRFDLLACADSLCRRGSFQAFAPLPRQLSQAMPTTGFEDVRLIALARLFVSVPRIQVDWPLYGPKLAQVGLTFGADDVDGVSALDDTGEGRRRAPLEEIRRNIVAASGEPVERDGLFRPRR